MKKSIFESYFSQYESKITIQTITYGRLNSVIYDVELPKNNPFNLELYLASLWAIYLKIKKRKTQVNYISVTLFFIDSDGNETDFRFSREKYEKLFGLIVRIAHFIESNSNRILYKIHFIA